MRLINGGLISKGMKKKKLMYGHEMNEEILVGYLDKFELSRRRREDWFNWLNINNK